MKRTLLIGLLLMTASLVGLIQLEHRVLAADQKPRKGVENAAQSQLTCKLTYTDPDKPLALTVTNHGPYAVAKGTRLRLSYTTSETAAPLILFVTLSSHLKVNESRSFPINGGPTTTVSSCKCQKWQLQKRPENRKR